MVSKENENVTGGELFGFAILKFFTVFAGSLAIGATISMISALLFKVSKFQFETILNSLCLTVISYDISKPK